MKSKILGNGLSVAVLLLIGFVPALFGQYLDRMDAIQRGVRPQKTLIEFELHWTPVEELGKDNYKFFFFWSTDQKSKEKKLFSLEVLWKSTWKTYFLRRRTPKNKVEAFGFGEGLINNLKRSGNPLIMDGDVDLTRPYIITRVGYTAGGKGILKISTDKETTQIDHLFAEANKLIERREILRERNDGTPNTTLPEQSRHAQYELGEAFMFQTRKHWVWDLSLPKSAEKDRSVITALNEIKK